MEDRLYRDTINRYGKIAQSIVAIEELSELQKEITKYLRGSGSVDHIAEEVADVEIILEQTKMIHGITDAQLADWKKQKRHKLKMRLEND